MDVTVGTGALLEEESREERNARWIAAIEEAHENYTFDPRVDPSKYDELEDRLLRRLGFRTPPIRTVEASASQTGSDLAPREDEQEMALLVSYAALLFKEPEFPEKFRRFHSGETSIDFHRETWSAAHRLSRELGVARTPEPIHITLGRIKRDHEAAVGRPSSIPFPAGDPPR